MEGRERPTTEGYNAAVKQRECIDQGRLSGRFVRFPTTKPLLEDRLAGP